MFATLSWLDIRLLPGVIVLFKKTFSEICLNPYKRAFHFGSCDRQRGFAGGDDAFTRLLCKAQSAGVFAGVGLLDLFILIALLTLKFMFRRRGTPQTNGGKSE